LCPIFSPKKKKKVLVALELPTFGSPRCKNLPHEKNPKQILDITQTFSS
jgi:hypothetical protein